MKLNFTECDSFNCDSLFFDTHFLLNILYNYIYIN